MDTRLFASWLRNRLLVPFPHVSVCLHLTLIEGAFSSFGFMFGHPFMLTHLLYLFSVLYSVPCMAGPLGAFSPFNGFLSC